MSAMDTLYHRILKPVLFKIHPDTVHEIFITIGAFVGRFWILRRLFNFLYGYHGADISKTVDGITYHTPVLLSAGFDPDGHLTQILPSLSFGGEEIGSITAHPCEGNAKPHFTRLIRNKSIVVYKGLRNKGVDALIKKLRERGVTLLRKETPRSPRSKFVLGISIARTNEKAASTVEAGINDYVESFKKLNEAGIGDYYAINISCPNAHTGETFTDPKLLAQLLPRLMKIPHTKPVYLKMPINMQWDQFSELLVLADKNDIQGLIIGNVNKKYEHLKHPEDAPKEFRGGLSGAPCKELSNELIRKTRTEYGARFTIIGSGGIMTPEDAMEKFAAGADLIQVLSGMIFEGPGLIKAICEKYHDSISL
ncbi:MAG: hypothetical protein NTU85_02915 [Candidatus Kaiserbacteria bacterium]|nr:hypothetical protein [Candidatus Kaiserbacteria bacterium]